MERVEGQTHDLAAGVVVVRDDTVLAVREHGRWGLPKGGVEPGEFFAEAAAREATEETGLDVTVGDLAFVSEIRITDREQHLQRFYTATASGVPDPADPDGEVDDVAFLPVEAVAETIVYRPQILPLLAWLDDRLTGYHRFDLRTEPVDLGGD
jgi:ADP-ribose pyrophosphatase YjhB (NUDIX family)